MHDIARFTLRDLADCGAAFRRMSSEAGNMEEVANRAVRYLYDGLVDPATGKSSCALVRLFKTQAFGQLSEPLRAVARKVLGGQAPPETMPCLTLLATAGEQPQWNARAQSTGHQAIPLVSEQAVEKAPMIATLIRQMGLEVGALLRPNPAILVDLQQRSFNVFHVPEALGSPYIPAQQEFVIPHHVASVLGFGGLLPSGSLFAVIIFSKCPISRETAGLFKPLALSLKLALLPFEGRVFAGP